MLSGGARVEDLARVQREREWPTRIIQALQSALQKRLIATVLRAQGPPRIPWFVRWFFRVPILCDLPARVLAFGVTKVRLRDEA